MLVWVLFLLIIFPISPATTGQIMWRCLGWWKPWWTSLALGLAAWLETRYREYFWVHKKTKQQCLHIFSSQTVSVKCNALQAVYVWIVAGHLCMHIPKHGLVRSWACACTSCMEILLQKSNNPEKEQSKPERSRRSACPCLETKRPSWSEQFE